MLASFAAEPATSAKGPNESRYAFVVSGDPQYLAERSQQPARLDRYSKQANARWIEVLNGLPGRKIPESLGGGLEGNFSLIKELF